MKTKGNGKRFVEWDTPSGFPVIYEKYRTKSDACKAWVELDGKPMRITHKVKIPTKNADRRGFAKGIAANWVHSHDAAHMALIIDQWDGEFACVHDSFSVHGADIETLMDQSREWFITMYDSPNYLLDMKDMILTNQQDCDVKIPDLGTLNIEVVRDSDYFFC